MTYQSTLMARIVALLCCFLAAPAHAQGTRWAIVIGINEYSRPDVTPLRYAVNDARLVAKTLVENAGFPPSQVALMTSDGETQDKPTLGNVLSRLNDLSGKVRSSDLFVFYFSGHGIALEGKPFMCTLDADPRSLDTLEVSCLKVDVLREKLRAVSAGRNLIVMDACQNDPRGGRSLSGNLLSDAFVRDLKLVQKDPNRPNNTEVLYALLFACSVGQRAYEWPEFKQGFYSYFLVNGLRGGAKEAQGRVTVGSLSDFVEKRVPQSTAQIMGDDVKQTPSAVYLPGEAGRNMILISPSTLPGPIVPPAPETKPVVKPPTTMIDVKPAGTNTNAIDDAIMVLVPKGNFIMGSDEGLPAEQPKHQVGLDEYWIYQREVSNEQFLRFVEATGYEAQGNWRSYAMEAGRLNHPVINVTWNDAAAYCKWAGGRLPTEAEWEKAARGTDGRTYPWGNEWNPQLCNWADGGKIDGFGRSAPVESFIVGYSPYYAVNMVGNVWEWCADWFDPQYYRNSPRANPQGPNKTSSRAVRGGGFDFNMRGFPRCSVRAGAPPTEADAARGFRVVIEKQ